LTLGLLVVPRITTLRLKHTIIMIAKIAGAGIVMTVFALLVKYHLHPIVTIISSVFVYALAIVAFRAITKEEMGGLKKIFTKQEQV